MGRIHLFEFEDFRWFPAVFRNYQTDFLQYLSNKTNMWRGVSPLLLHLMEVSHTDTLIDLGTGGGGGMLTINADILKVKKQTRIVLTDLYPNAPAMARTTSMATNIEAIKYPVDARRVPKELKGVRTLFLSFHHFRPKEAKLILEDACRSGEPIALFEAQERSVKSILFMLLSPISVLLTTPLIRPFRIGRIIFTYLIPILPLIVCWDGLVSSLRTYSARELDMLISEICMSEAYRFEIGRIKEGPGTISYLIGYKSPKSESLS